jgi:hypothetical protein
LARSREYLKETSSLTPRNWERDRERGGEREHANWRERKGKGWRERMDYWDRRDSEYEDSLTIDLSLSPSLSSSSLSMQTNQHW